MPWRQDTLPYYVLVSELMLQQTQVARVVPKFEAFVARFPNEHSLADASLADVLHLWQGLGYNRRAKFLHDAAKKIVSDFGGTFPESEHEIKSLPGVGTNTTGAILAYAFNRPAVFIETNIRTVFINHFFADELEVHDRVIAERLSETLDREHVREYYWALMDYGSWLKRSGVKNINRSTGYKKQSPLEGSVRQVRGQILRVLGTGTMSQDSLQRALAADERFEPALRGLEKDGLVTISNHGIHLTK